MKYAKPVIKDKFWIVKDESVNIATIEKREDSFIVIEANVKTKVETIEAVNEKFGEDIFSNTPSSLAKPIHQKFDIDGYPVKVEPFNVEWFDTIPTFTKSQKSSDRYCAGFYGVRFEGGTFLSNNPKLSTITEKCVDFIGPYKTEMEASINISTRKQKIKSNI
tara:strand:+ start:263 stop:751 length:489 start_codon:yes stop_codon:yes gene_type:complete